MATMQRPSRVARRRQQAVKKSRFVDGNAKLPADALRLFFHSFRYLPISPLKQPTQIKSSDFRLSFTFEIQVDRTLAGRSVAAGIEGRVGA
jgi:hypothetical protein